jgi:hypothetical protein
MKKFKMKYYYNYKAIKNKSKKKINMRIGIYKEIYKKGILYINKIIQIKKMSP